MVILFSDVRYPKRLTCNLISQPAAFKDGFNPHLHLLEFYADRDHDDCIE